MPPDLLLQGLPGLAGPWVLLFARVSGAAWTAPGWGTVGVGFRMRLLLAALLTAALGPSLIGSGTLPTTLGAGALVRSVLGEAAVGAALGWSAGLIVAAAKQAGELVGAQAGLSAASLLDPEAVDGMTPTGHLYGLIALMVFVAMDGPLSLAGTLLESYRVLPAGGPDLSLETASRAFGMVGRSLELALRLAAPAAVALMLAGLALALVARAAPAFPFLSLALPARSAVGLALVAAGLGGLVAALAIAWGTTWGLG